MAGESLFKEDAERLADLIVDENPMVDILDIRMDPQLGGYVITAYDYGADEEFTVDRLETWNAKRAQHIETHATHRLTGKVHEKRGRKIGSVLGHWVEVHPDDWPDEICDAVARRCFPGESLTDLEPALAEAQAIYPGGGRPEDYSFDGRYLAMVKEDSSRVFKQIVKLANFTLEDQSDRVEEWRTLGFDISPRPQAPFIEPGTAEWNERELVEEVKDRLLDLSDSGYGAILLDGSVNATAYAWVLAGVLGLKVVMAWEQSVRTAPPGVVGLGFSELLHYKEVEELL